ncbi:hypothetical protein MUY27_17545 [Mucilaginibacter sp. RS28]|uniref:Adenylosuccinate lyase n=1 Tax=Mucilaginibacter straminoryzae TaxID=2932774 RepID=A0A9X1X8A2_9SPHI|nr:hypothetical protein [Mucilaginibacter straminoryzae]MCJ8211528.1 hypothetical protein [Mucilaginibacter straminoryzae]
MLTKDQLLKQLSATMGKTKVVELSNILFHKNFKLTDLIDLTFHPDKKIAFRAAWLLENLFLHRPDCYLHDVNYLISRFDEVTYPSCQRHYAKIAMHITSPKAIPDIRHILATTDLDAMVNKCFEWLIAPEVLVAVKAFACEALFNLRHRYPWIAEELPAQLEFLMRNGTAAIQSKGKKLLSYLQPLEY